MPFFHHTPEEPHPIEEEDLELFRNFSEGDDASTSMSKRRRQVINALTKSSDQPTQRTTPQSSSQAYNWDSPFPWMRRAPGDTTISPKQPNFVQSTISAKLTYAAYNYVPDESGHLRKERATGFAPQHLAERRSMERVKLRRGVGKTRISKKPKSLMHKRIPELGNYTKKRRFYRCMMCKNVSWRHMKKHTRCKDHRLLVISNVKELPAEERIVAPAPGTEKYKKLKWNSVSFNNSGMMKSLTVGCTTPSVVKSKK